MKINNVRTNYDLNVISFKKVELMPIMNIYGQMVASGQWRDYGISNFKEKAVFSAYKHTSHAPLYIIEKQPKLIERNSLYSIHSIDGEILKRGNNLPNVLKIFQRKLMKIV